MIGALGDIHGDFASVRGAGDGAQAAGDAFLEPVLITHEHLLAAIFRENRNLLVGVVHGDRLLEHVPQGQREPLNQRDDHPLMI